MMYYEIFIEIHGTYRPMHIKPKGVKGRKNREKSRFSNKIEEFPALNKISGFFPTSRSGRRPAGVKKKLPFLCLVILFELITQ